ncbi:MAG: hypothetical protein PHU78_01095 [Heliobacteriaceae bacterium]|nr:hypothetical protein [Heliobacteriaceae bacterium]
MEQLAEELRNTYTTKIEVSFQDVTGEDPKKYFTIHRISRAGYPPPYVFIENQPRLAGGISIDQIKEILDPLVK